MADLSPEAQALVRSGRRAYRPSDADRERVLAALRGRLGDAVVVGAAAPSSFVASGRASAIRAALSHWKTIGFAALAGGSLIFTLQHEYGHPSSLPRVPSATIVVGAATNDLLPSSDDAPPPEASTRTEEPVAEARPAPAARHARDGLSDEIAILSRAETELHGGRPESALKALDEHERRFPNGVLTEERTAARVQALCALGRTTEADAELARLARISPHSAHEERARQACHVTAPVAP